MLAIGESSVDAVVAATVLEEAPFELGRVVEPALARALTLAAEAGRWQLVAKIATSSRSADKRVIGRERITISRARRKWPERLAPHSSLGDDA